MFISAGTEALDLPRAPFNQMTQFTLRVRGFSSRTIHISSNGENAPFIEEQFEPYQELNLVSSSQEDLSKPAKTRICVHQDRTLAF